jgi:hypothetical protein
VAWLAEAGLYDSNLVAQVWRTHIAEPAPAHDGQAVPGFAADGRNPSAAESCGSVFASATSTGMKKAEKYPT